MNLPARYVVSFSLLIAAFFGYNAWLIQRDNQLFDAYYHKTAKQQYCEQMKTRHHDCNVE